MIELIDKIKSLIQVLEKENAPLSLCALFLREEPLERWDVVVSAPWLSSQEMQSYRTVSSKLQDSLSDSELVQVSRVVILDQNDPVVSYLQGLETITNGGYTQLSVDELSTKFKFSIRKAYLLRSQKPTK